MINTKQRELVVIFIFNLIGKYFKMEILFTNPLNKIQIIINHFHIHYSASFIIKFSYMTIIIDFIIILT